MVRQPPKQKAPQGVTRACQDPTALQGSPVRGLMGSSPGHLRSAPKETRGATRGRAFLRKNKKEIPQPAGMPQSPHSQPRTLRVGPSLTVSPQIALLAVHLRHGHRVFRFRANRPETGAGAETGATQKTNQRLQRLRTSFRKATDVPRRAAPRPRPSRGRAFGARW